MQPGTRSHVHTGTAPLAPVRLSGNLTMQIPGLASSAPKCDLRFTPLPLGQPRERGKGGGMWRVFLRVQIPTSALAQPAARGPCKRSLHFLTPAPAGGGDGGVQTSNKDQELGIPFALVVPDDERCFATSASPFVWCRFNAQQPTTNAQHPATDHLHMAQAGFLVRHSCLPS